MKKIMIFLVISLISINLLAQNAGHITGKQMTADCKQCHVCDTPTKADPCLILCPRHNIKSVRHSPEEGPNMLIIDEFEDISDLYQPVNFSHRLHSEMSDMSGGCSLCHHYNPPGNIVKCTECHSKERQRTDISKPDLKGAFHRQCINCHNTWEEETKCVYCHALNGKNATAFNPKTANTKKVHPIITRPQKILYETEFEDGKLVTFYHNEHVQIFDLSCSDCHKEETCARCHNKKEKKIKAYLSDAHEKCSACHDTEDNCSRCHNEKEAFPFNHKTRTGFALEKKHSGLSCIACHKSTDTFKKLSPKCSSCHNWNIENFNHKITGLQLDDTHSEFYCENCHIENQYDKTPSCIDCHDEEMKYPKMKPGKMVN